MLPEIRKGLSDGAESSSVSRVTLKKTRQTSDVVSPNQNLPFELPKAMDIIWDGAVRCPAPFYTLCARLQNGFENAMRPVHHLAGYTTHALDGDAYINTFLLRRPLLSHLQTSCLPPKRELIDIMVWILLLLSSKLWTEATCRLPAPETQEAHTGKPLPILQNPIATTT